MPVPDFQTLMRPLLELHADGRERSSTQARQALAEAISLSSEDREELLPSGAARRFDNRVAWATTYLCQAQLLERVGRGVTRITERGHKALSEFPDRIDIKALNRYPEFVAFRQRTQAEDDGAAADTDEEEQATPEEAMVTAARKLESALAQELLDRILESSPTFFEQLVIDLLLAMGYGGSREAAARRLGRSGDGGVDGVISEDRLGLDVIYVQAKRWSPERSVGRPEVQSFVGALQGMRASKGVFMTTARFSRDALDFVATIPGSRVVLIDGTHLTRLMIEHNVGVSSKTTYAVKRVDEDYFAADL